jgi:mannose/fructose/N-acetylgalactosamine-specific phosphotransferase system component IID
MGARGKKIFIILAVVATLVVSFVSTATAYAYSSDLVEEMAAEITVDSISVFSLIVLICCSAVTTTIIVASVISSNRKRKKQDYRHEEHS